MDMNNARARAPRAETAACELCGADDCEPLFQGEDRRHDLPGRYAMARCRRCGHVYLNPRPDPETLPLYYPEDYAPYDPHRGFVGRLTAALRRREAKSLRRSVPAGGRILEIGCAAGDLLVPLRELGFEVVGVEMSSYAASIARERHGLTVHTGSLADVSLDPGSFDAVIMRNVIEHVRSPKGDLQRVATLLRPGGHLFIATDNFASLDRRVFGQDWYGYDLPRHLNLFTPQTLTALLEATGFRVRRVGYSLVPNHWIVSSRYAFERRLGRNPVTRLLSIRNPILLSAFLPVTLAQRAFGNGGRMSVVATKEVPVATAGAASSVQVRLGGSQAGP